MLSADSLRFYKDSLAEEVISLFCLKNTNKRVSSLKMFKCFFVYCHQASDLEGEIDLTKCFNVSEYQVQRNYGFQIHVRKTGRQQT